MLWQACSQHAVSVQWPLLSFFVFAWSYCGAIFSVFFVFECFSLLVWICPGIWYRNWFSMFWYQGLAPKCLFLPWVHHPGIRSLIYTWVSSLLSKPWLLLPLLSDLSYLFIVCFLCACPGFSSIKEPHIRALKTLLVTHGLGGLCLPVVTPAVVAPAIPVLDCFFPGNLIHKREKHLHQYKKPFGIRLPFWVGVE